VRRVLADIKESFAKVIGQKNKNTRRGCIVITDGNHHLFPLQEFVTIHLSGHIHTNDDIALAEISRQLDAQSAVSNGEDKTFSHSLNQLLTQLGHGGVGKPVVFVLDELDVFAVQCKKTLYNILDIMHSNECVMAIVGQTVRRDVMDLLEKRMKSRFSHTTTFCPPLEDGEQCVELIRRATTLPDCFEDPAFAKRVSAAVETILKNAEFSTALENFIAYDTSPRSLLRMTGLAMIQLSTKQPFPTLAMFGQALKVSAIDSVKLRVLDLSVLELLFLVAMKRLEDRNVSSYNFEAVFAEYDKFVKVSQGLALCVLASALSHVLCGSRRKREGVNTSTAKGSLGRPLIFCFRPSWFESPTRRAMRVGLASIAGIYLSN